jgi:nicotinate-nucleotide adenylyltransferase
LPKQKSKKPKKQPKGKKRAEPKQAAKSAKPAKQLKRADGKQAKQARRAEKKQTKEAKRAAGKQAKQGKKARALNGSTRQSKKPDRKDKTPAPPRQITQLPMAASNMRVGLLGGSFNPPHEAHIAISLAALKRLGLDRVWWLVTPGNPLKNGATLPSLAERVQGAKRLVAKHPGIEVTGFAGQKASSYTVDVLADLKRRAPTVKFVWLMGADNLADFHRWRSWEKIFRLMPMAVLDRPTFRLRARASKAAHRFSEFLVDESDASGLAQLTPPAWTIMSHKLSSLSSTALRATKPKSQKGKGKSKKNNKKAKKH